MTQLKTLKDIVLIDGTTNETDLKSEAIKWAKRARIEGEVERAWAFIDFFNLTDEDLTETGGENE